MDNRYRLFGLQEVTMSMTRGEDTSIISPCGIFIKGELNYAKLEKAVQKLVKESDAMKIVFERDENTKKLYMKPLDSYTYTLDVRDAVGVTKEEKEEFIKNDFFEATRKIEYLPDGKVKWNCILYKYSETEHGLWFGMSHLLADGLSVTNALTRIVLRYNGLPLPPMSSFLDYVKEQYKLEEEPEYKKLRAEFAESIKDYKAPVDYSKYGTNESRYRELVTLDISELRKFARSNKMSLFHCTLFMFHAAITATYKAKDSLIGVAVGVRKLKNMSSIGEFLTGYIDRNIFESNDSMKEMAVRCKQRYLAESKKDLALYDLFRNGTEFILSYQNFGDDSKDIKFGKAVARPYDNIDEFVKPFHWASLSLDAYESGNELALMAGLDNDIMSGEVLERMKNAFIIANRVLSGEDMTFGEYCKAVDESVK